jgi:hypothetical protein
MREQRGNPYQTPVQLRTSAPRQTEEHVSSRYRQPRTLRGADDENDDAWTGERGHTSAIRYDTPRRTAMLDDPKKTRLIKHRRFDRSTLMILLCLTIIVMVGGWFLFSALANWWTGVQENITYGNPRTFQADEYTGLGDTPDHPDHFIALNLHGVIEVVQINPQDRNKDAVYVLANVGNESTPASLSFRDTTGSGHIDIIVTIGDSTPYTIMLLNNGKTLVPTQPAH